MNVTPASIDHEKDIWPGLDSYSESSAARFFGRDVEAAALTARITSPTGRVTVLFGPSGTGKTSLLQAGVFPSLRKAGFLPVPIRLKFIPDTPTGLRREIAKELARQLTERPGEVAEIDLAGSPAVRPPEQETLWEYLHHVDVWSPGGELLAPVIVIDQFEEIFTRRLDPASHAAWLRDLGDAAENSLPADLRDFLNDSGTALPFDPNSDSTRFVFALREDFVPRLDDISSSLPSLVKRSCRMRLQPLNAEAALQAVCGPARLPDGRCIVDEDVARLIVWAAAGEAPETYAPDRPMSRRLVDPSILSLECRELNLLRFDADPPSPAITAEMVERHHTDFLQHFVERAIKGMPDTVLAFVESLVDDGGFRAGVSEQAAERQISVEQIETLVNRRLLRREQRGGDATYLELSHDVLTKPIQSLRDQRRQQQERAREQQEAVALRQRLRRTQIAVVLIALLGALAIIAFVSALRATRRAKDAEDKAKAQTVAAENAKAELAHSLAEFFARDGHAARARRDWAAAMRFYQEALDQDPGHLGARLGLGDASSSLVPEVAHWRMNRPVKRLRFSRDGRWVAMAKDDNTIQIWSADTWREQVELEGHTTAIKALAFSPDGSTLASAATDGTIKIWRITPDLEGKRLQKTLTGHSDWVRDLAFNTDGTLLASASDDKTFRLWAADANYRLLDTNRYHTGWVQAVQFSPDGAWLATSANDKKTCLWKLNATAATAGRSVKDAGANDEGDQKQPFGPNLGKPGVRVSVGNAPEKVMYYKNNGTSVTFSPDGRTLAVRYVDGNVGLWSVTEGTRNQLLQFSDAIEGAGEDVCYTPTGHFFMIKERAVYAWTVDPYVRVGSIRMIEEDIAAAAVNPNEPWVLTARDDGLLRLWRVGDHGQFSFHRSLSGEANDQASSLLASDDSGEANDQASSLLAMLRQLVGQSAETALCMGVIPGRRRIVFSSGDQVRTIDAGKPEPSLLGKAGGNIRALAVSADERWLAEGLADGTVQVRDANSGQVVRTATHTKEVLAIAVSADGQTLVSGHADGDVCFWTPEGDSLRGTCRHIEHNDSNVGAVALDHRGNLAASGSSKGVVFLWEIEKSNHPAAVLRGHEKAVRALAFSPDDATLASAGDEGPVRLWDVESRRERALCRGHYMPVRALAFEPRGAFLVSGSDDNRLRFWQLDTGKELANIYTDVKISGLGFLEWEEPGVPALAVISTADPQILVVSLPGLVPEESARLTTALELGFPWALDASSIPYASRAPWKLAESRFAAAREGRLPWVPEGGRAWLHLYEEDFKRTQSVRSSMALYEAVRNGDAEAVGKLAASNINLDAECLYGTTALTLACEKGYEDIVTILLDGGAKVNHPRADQLTALRLAVAQNNPSLIGLLCRAGADTGPGVRAAVRERDWNSLQLLSQTYKADLNTRDTDGATPLMRAASAKEKEAVTQLVRLGADVNAPDQEGSTALVSAVRDGDAEIATVLLNAGADVNVSAKRGWTPLMFVAEQGNADMARLLLDHGADIEAQHVGGSTSLVVAVDNEKPEMVALLLDRGAKVDAADNDGWTPLMFAARDGNIPIAQALQEAGADANARDKRGSTALMVAGEQGNVDMARLLLDRGAKVDARNDYGSTALMVAAANARAECALLLLQQGAHPRTVDYLGYTATTGAPFAGSCPELLPALFGVASFSLQAVRTKAATDPDGMQMVVEALVCASDLAVLDGDHGAARKHLESALAVIRTDHPYAPLLQQLVLERLAQACYALADYEQARRHQQDYADLLHQRVIDHPVLKPSLGAALGNLAWYCELVGRFDDALAPGEEAVTLLTDDGPAPARVNLAHALLFTGQFDKAKVIHEKYAGTAFPDGRQWNNEARSDFKAFRAAGYDHPDMKKIEALLGIDGQE